MKIKFQKITSDTYMAHNKNTVLAYIVTQKNYGINRNWIFMATHATNAFGNLKKAIKIKGVTPKKIHKAFILRDE